MSMMDNYVSGYKGIVSTGNMRYKLNIQNFEVNLNPFGQDAEFNMDGTIESMTNETSNDIKCGDPRHTSPYGLRFGTDYIIKGDDIYIKSGLWKKNIDSIASILPQVVDWQAFNNKVVKVWFKDGSYETSVCSDEDEFSVEVGITICIVKRFLCTNLEDGTKRYNDYIKNVLKIADKKAEAKKKAEELEAELKRREEKEKARKAKRAARKRQQRIDDIAEAINKSKIHATETIYYDSTPKKTKTTSVIDNGNEDNATADDPKYDPDKDLADNF